MNSSQKSKSSQTTLSDIERIFFENFTKRQESNNDFLLRLLLIVGSVIAGYAYLLLNIDVVKADKYVVMFMVLFTEILLMIYFKIIYDEGFAFRRDQLVVFRILKRHGLIAECESEDCDINKIFPYYYHPLKKFDYAGKLKRKKRRQFFLMPAFHNTLASSILVMQITVYGSFYVKFMNTYSWYWLVALISLNFFICIRIVLRKNKWLEELYQKAFVANSQFKTPKDPNFI